MNSTTAPKAIEPDDVVVARADERLVHAYDQIARADEQLARLNEQLAKLEHARASLRLSSATGHRGAGGRCAASSACYWQCASLASLSFRSPPTARRPSRLSPGGRRSSWHSSLRMEKPAEPAQPGPSGVQLAAATPVLPQSIASAQAAPEDVAPTAAPTLAELAQLLQTMARDLANVEQGIVQLKTSQEESARDNAKATEELKASQEQMTRLIARLDNKVSEQSPRPKTSVSSAAAVPPTAAPKPVPVRPSPQARAQPQPPMQLQPDDDQ